MTHGNRKRVYLVAIALEERRTCESCWIGIPIGDVAIVFDGAGDQARTFCVRCVSGVSIEAVGLRRYQRRARPVLIRIRSKEDDCLMRVIEVAGGCTVARRRLPALKKNLDLDLVRVDLSDLEDREARRRRPGQKGS